MDRGGRAARRQHFVGQTLEGLQAEVDAGPGYCCRKYTKILQNPSVNAKSEDILIGYLPGHPFADYSKGHLTMGSEDIEICTGNVLRDVSGEEHMVVFIRFWFEGALDAEGPDKTPRPYLEQGRFGIVGLKIQATGSGRKLNAGLANALREVSLSSTFAIGECTGVEAQILRARLEAPCDPLGRIFTGVADPAAFMEATNDLDLHQRLQRAVNLSIGFLENGPLLNERTRRATSGANKAAADAIRARFPSIASASVGPYLNTDAAGDSTTDLADEDAKIFPPQLVCFLPDVQQQRLAEKKSRSLAAPATKRSLPDSSENTPSDNKARAQKKNTGAGRGKGGGRRSGGTLVPVHSPGSGTIKNKYIEPGASERSSLTTSKRGAKITAASSSPSDLSEALENCQARCEELHNQVNAEKRKVTALQDLSIEYVKALKVEIEATKNVAAMALTILQSNEATARIKLPAVTEALEPDWYVRMTRSVAERNEAALRGATSSEGISTLDFN